MAPNGLGEDTVDRTGSANSSNAVFSSRTAAVVMFLGFLPICFALGYSALTRYVPWEEANYDSFWYCRMVAGETVEAPFGYRVLTPTLARGLLPVVARLHLGGWDPALVSLLAVNAVFTSLTAVLLMKMAVAAGGDATVGVLTPFIFLSSFVVVNYHLAGLVDAGEMFFLTAVLLALLTGRWAWIPLLVGFGVAAKETVLPLAVAAAVGWWLAARLRGSRCSRQAATAILAMVVVGAAAHGACRWAAGVPPYVAHTLSMKGLQTLGPNLAACVFERTQVYAFAFLLPVGMMRLGRLPVGLLAASGSMAAAATLLGAYAGIAGNLHRPLFCTLGPILIVAAAMFVRDLMRGATKPPEETTTPC